MSARMVASSVLVALAFVAGCKSSSHSDVELSRGVTPEKEKQSAQAPKKQVPLAIDSLDAPAKITVTSSAFKQGEPIPATYSDYGEKASPPLMWMGVPAGAKSIVLIVDDPDAAEPKPFIHWVLYNLPASITELRTAVPATGQVRQLGNAKQGGNSRGSVGYFGPKPPPNDPPHHYHFQIFALDAILPVEQAATKSDVLAAAKGHVVAKGELVGTFEKKMP